VWWMRPLTGASLSQPHSANLSLQINFLWLIVVLMSYHIYKNTLFSKYILQLFACKINPLQQLRRKHLALYQPMEHICIMRLAASWCHIWQCPWEIGSMWAERVGGGWVGTLEGYKQHGHVWAWLWNPVVGARLAISLVLSVNSPWNQYSRLVKHC